MSIGRITCKDCVPTARPRAATVRRSGARWLKAWSRTVGVRGITNWRNIVGDHRRDAHRMNLTGALWTDAVRRGQHRARMVPHELEANPSDVMLRRL